MIDNRIAKFESPIRIQELKPLDTLIKAGFKENMTLCDIGAGTGIFSFPAAEISTNHIYALEISDEMIELLKSRSVQLKTENLKIRKVDSHSLPLNNGSCDMIIMVTVLHELKDKEIMISEIKRILKKKGRLVIIEFHKRKTPMGPPNDLRLSEEYVNELCISNHLKAVDKFTLGENLYCAVFEL